MIIGAHVSAAGGLIKVIPRAKALGVSAIQIFASAPGNWNPPKATLDEARAFGQECRFANITHIFFHSVYLINLASDNPELVQKSESSLVAALNLNAAMDGSGVIFHVGSAKTRTFANVQSQVKSALATILQRSDPLSRLIIETNAGQGNCIGDTFEEVAALLDGVSPVKRLGVCFDTAHAYASGYDLVNRPAHEVIEEFNRVIGLERLAAIHCNDSKTPFNSRVDRHENIGYGTIGEAPFCQLLHLPQLEEVPFILEVPGIEGHGPDQANVDKLKRLAGMSIG